MSAQEKVQRAGSSPHFYLFPLKKKWWYLHILLNMSVKASEGQHCIITNLSFFNDVISTLQSRLSEMRKFYMSTQEAAKASRQIQIWSLVSQVLTASQLSGVKSVADNQVQHKSICVHLLWPSSAGQSMDHQELYKHMAPLTTKYCEICVLRRLVYVLRGLSHKNVILCL